MLVVVLCCPDWCSKFHCTASALNNENILNLTGWKQLPFEPKKNALQVISDLTPALVIKKMPQRVAELKGPGSRYYNDIKNSGYICGYPWHFLSDCHFYLFLLNSHVLSESIEKKTNVYLCVCYSRWLIVINAVKQPNMLSHITDISCHTLPSQKKSELFLDFKTWHLIHFQAK